MKRMLILFSSVAFTFLLSCEKDSEPNCPPPTGEMIAQINDTIVWDFKYVRFYSEVDSLIGIGAGFVNAGCELELSLDFHNIEQTLEKRILVKPIYGEDHPSLLQQILPALLPHCSVDPYFSHSLSCFPDSLLL